MHTNINTPSSDEPSLVNNGWYVREETMEELLEESKKREKLASNLSFAASTAPIPYTSELYVFYPQTVKTETRIITPSPQGPGTGMYESREPLTPVPLTVTDTRAEEKEKQPTQNEVVAVKQMLRKLKRDASNRKKVKKKQIDIEQ
jgi:hypothetical protein